MGVFEFDKFAKGTMVSHDADDDDDDLGTITAPTATNPPLLSHPPGEVGHQGHKGCWKARPYVVGLLWALCECRGLS
jgi:hypothetical protein